MRGCLRVVSERRQRPAQHVNETCGLEKQGLELLEDRGVVIRLEMNLSSLHRPSEQAGAWERFPNGSALSPARDGRSYDRASSGVRATWRAEGHDGHSRGGPGSWKSAANSGQCL
jgi:hypothetical protein